MLNPFVSSLIFTAEMLIFYVFFSRIMDSRISAMKTLLIGIVLAQIGSGVNLLSHNTPLFNLFGSLLTRVLFIFLCFETKPIQSVFYGIVFELINVALEMMTVSALGAISHLPIMAYNENFALLVANVTICKTLLMLTCLFLAQVIRPDADAGKFPIGLFLTPISAVVCITIFFFVLSSEDYPSSVQSALSIACIFIFITSVLQIVLYQHQMDAQRQQLRMKSEYERLKTEKSYYDILEQQNQQLMIYAHDAKNHLAAIAALNDNPTIDGYLTQMSDRLKSYSKNCHSGNMMLDVMLGKYVLDCRNRAIDFRYEVQGCNLRQMEDMDLVAVLGNLMDNALQGASGSAAKVISLETTRRNGYSILIVTNSCDTPPRIREGSLMTTKQNPAAHGFGLKSVKETLKKYHGDFSWEYDEVKRVFTTTVMVEDQRS